MIRAKSPMPPMPPMPSRTQRRTGLGSKSVGRRKRPIGGQLSKRFRENRRSNNGRARFGTNKRRRQGDGRGVPIDRGQPPAQRGRVVGRLVRRLGMEAEWRADFVDIDAGRRGSDRAVIPVPNWKRGMAGRRRADPDPVDAVPLRRTAPLFRVSRHRQRRRVPSPRGQALLRGPLLPVPALLPADPCKPQRGLV